MNYDTKPWGFEMIIASTNNYSGRIIVIKEGEKTPLGYHKSMDKTIFVLQGLVSLNIENKSKTIGEQSNYHINPNIIHQIIAVKGDATILEIGTKLAEDFVEISI